MLRGHARNYIKFNNHVYLKRKLEYSQKLKKKHITLGIVHMNNELFAFFFFFFNCIILSSNYINLSFKIKDGENIWPTLNS